MVVLRRRIKRDVALTRGGKEGQQQVLALGWDEVQEDAQLWEYTVLVTDVDYELGAIGQLYRDRCDCVDLGFCQNGFDELKNQWGWGGFTTQDMHRSELTARAVALVYNWWSWYVRAANPLPFTPPPAPHFTLMQLRFALLTVTSSQRDLHPQVCAHAGRTDKKTGLAAGFNIEAKMNVIQPCAPQPPPWCQSCH